MNFDAVPVADDQAERPPELDPGNERKAGTDLDYVEMPCTDGVVPGEDEHGREIRLGKERDPQPEAGDWGSCRTPRAPIVRLSPL